MKIYIVFRQYGCYYIGGNTSSKKSSMNANFYMKKSKMKVQVNHYD